MHPFTFNHSGSKLLKMKYRTTTKKFPFVITNVPSAKSKQQPELKRKKFSRYFIPIEFSIVRGYTEYTYRLEDQFKLAMLEQTKSSVYKFKGIERYAILLSASEIG